MNKLKNRQGFSLAETLLATLILLLVSVIVATGVPAATNAYEKVVIGANAKVLLSTTISALRNELATARNVQVGGVDLFSLTLPLPTLPATTITYYSADKGATSRLYLGTTDRTGEINTILLQDYIDLDPGKLTERKRIRDVPPRSLVPESAATDDLYVTYDSITSFNQGDKSITINGLKVCRVSKPGVPMAEVAALTIRFIKPTATLNT